MPVFIDSAKLAEVRHAATLGWVTGVTTNPLLLAQSGLPPEQTLRELSATGIGPVYYQLVSQTCDQMAVEAARVREIVPGELVLKMPPVLEAYRFIAGYRQQYTFCVTAVFSPAQALVASEVGARSVAIYVNRATRTLGDGLALVAQTARVLAGSQTTILAASIKTPEEASGAIAAGAASLTIGYEALLNLTRHAMTDETLERFNAQGVGIQVR